MSFVAEWIDAAEPSRLALVAIGRDGARREITFGDVAARPARLAGALAARGVARGDVVMTVVGNRPEWAYAMLACWRLGAVALPCTEQLRPADLRARMEAVDPRAVVAGAGGPRPAHGRGGRRSGADRLHVGHRGRAEADPARAPLPGGPARAGGALV